MTDISCIKTDTQINQAILFDVMRLWGLQLQQVHDEIPLAGSPERCEYRMVVESSQGARFILEQVFSHTVDRKRWIAGCLDDLSSAGLEGILPYRKVRNGDQVVASAGRFWQLQNFLPGVALDRPAYALEGWRGRAAAKFLCELKQRSVGVIERCDGAFSLKAYSYRLMNDIRHRDHVYYESIAKIFDFLQRDFFVVYDHLPIGFCHGDYHPLNVIWTPQGIGAVIDWEFCGLKAELYDAANMVGCLGMEDPEALVGDCVVEFLDALRCAHKYHAKSWRYFYDLVVAVRFGWMAEWLRKKDREMIEMELDYWDILVEHREQLKTVWAV